MSSLNSVSVVARLSKDVELQTTSSGLNILNNTLAIDSYKGETSFVDIVMFNKTAEIASKYTKKGDMIAVTGSLKQDTWDDKETGKKRSKVVVVVNNLQLLGGQGEAKQADVVLDDIDDTISLDEIPFN